MAVEHYCQRHGRPAVASRVRLRPDGSQETEYLCEIDLAEERMRGASDVAASSMTSSPTSSASRREATAGRASGTDAAGRARRRHAVLQRRDARAAATRGPDGAGMGQPRPRQRPPPVRGVARRRGAPRSRADRRGSGRDRRAARGRGRASRANGRRTLALAGCEGGAPCRVRGVAGARGVLCRAGARAARARAGHRERGGTAARAIRHHPHEAPRRGHPRCRGRRFASRDVEDPEAGRVRPRPDRRSARGQARPGDRPSRRDRPDDRDPLAADEEQPCAARRAGRRQDSDRRGDRPADRQRRGARDVGGEPGHRARPRGDDRRDEVPRRVRGAAEDGDRRGSRRRGA